MTIGSVSNVFADLVCCFILESILDKCPFFRELALLNGDIEEHNLEKKAGPYHSQGNDLELNGQNAMACPCGTLNPDPVSLLTFSIMRRFRKITSSFRTPLLRMGTR